MFNAIREIYNLMADEESKQIFLDRFMYNITQNKYYIDKIASIYFERLKKQWEFYKDCESIFQLRKKIFQRKVVIYGIGQGGFAALALFNSVLKDADLQAFCDQKASMLSEYQGYKVISLEKLVKDYSTAIVLITPAAEQVRNEIINELISKGFDRNCIVEQIPVDLWTIRGQYFDDVLALGGGVKHLLMWGV